MNKIKFILLAAFLLLITTSTNNVFAQTLEGVWEGHVLSVSKNAKLPANAAFNWTTNKWGISLPNGTWASYEAKLDIDGSDYRNITGNYSADDKNNPKNSGHYAFTGSFNFDKKLMVWQPETKLGGNANAANTIMRSLTYSYKNGDEYEYLKGRWAAQDGSTAVGEFRRQYNGTPLRDDKVVADLMTVETDTLYSIKNGEFFLSLNDDKDGVVSKKDGEEENRKWKFEAAPKQFPKAFRIIPAGNEDKCLVSRGDDSIALEDKTDNPDGEQYWRFERTEGGVILVNVKLGGRGIFIEDEDSGKTILRSRNEAHENKWVLEKH